MLHLFEYKSSEHKSVAFNLVGHLKLPYRIFAEFEVLEGVKVISKWDAHVVFTLAFI